MSATCFIVGAAPGGDRVPFTPQAGDLVIGADGGYAHLQTLGIVPGIVLGDFDSLGYAPPHAHVLSYPKEKDDTDMMLAIRHGLDKGYRIFELYGGLGGQLDHTLANIQALTFLARHGARGTLIDMHTRATVICSGSLSFEAAERGTVSLFALDETVEGVTLSGLAYPLVDAALTNAFPLGARNAFTGEKSAVSVRKGALLIVWEKER
ncbi:MAG: thiamine diphosphokinase [Firmicutes bacterium]|nr:thiamine diphosphokinase [Bacillota bacterium]